MKSIYLSPSALNLLRDCPRCFWLDRVKRLKRPRGIYPSLPTGMDRVIKDYFDTYRPQGVLPPELDVSELKGAKLYQDQAQLDHWRNWREGLRFIDKDGAVLAGAVDELLVKDGLHIPFDYKTKGRPTTEEAATKYYQSQLECYALLLEENQHPTIGYGYLFTYSPITAAQHGEVRFQQQLMKVETNFGRARETFRQAVDLLRGPMPESAPGCEYCTWLQKSYDTVPPHRASPEQPAQQSFGF